MIKEQYVEVRWSSSNKQWYEEKGYLYTKTNNIFLVDVNDLMPSSEASVRVYCDYCHKEYKTSYNVYKKEIKRFPKSACKDCSEIKKKEVCLYKRREKLYEKFLQMCKENNYIPKTNKEDINDYSDDIYFVCPEHGRQKLNAKSIMNGAICYSCSRKNAVDKARENTLNYRQELLYEKALAKCKDYGYNLITQKSEIINNVTYVEYVCPKHGVHKVRVNNLNNGKRCPKCANEENSNNSKLSYDEVEDRIVEHGGVLLNKNDYKSIATKNLVVLCPSCKKEFITSLQDFTQHGGQLCEECNKKESFGESKIRQYLKNHCINFISEHWFPDCRDIRPLPFDFYLPDLNIIIEFDGRQHFGETNYFSYDYNTTKRHDDIKNKYCEEHSIGIIRIPYWNIDKIDKILNDKLTLHEDIV